MRFEIEEQETVITFDAFTGKWTFYSCVPDHIKKLLKDPSAFEDLEVLSKHTDVTTSIRFVIDGSQIQNFLLKINSLLSDL
ncbi:hypothetical protein V1502_08135 [Bacillus sp. SCS-153A]|uniref:hypothetical protein n=1 Tax=Rossellomorea sedimentorum TaxID=3115294 RepID=UPI0039066689